jgi:hypothetical protein
MHHGRTSGYGMPCCLYGCPLCRPLARRLVLGGGLASALVAVPKGPAQAVALLPSVNPATDRVGEVKHSEEEWFVGQCVHSRLPSQRFRMELRLHQRQMYDTLHRIHGPPQRLTRCRQSILGGDSYAVLRQEATERPFSRQVVLHGRAFR